ncbi:high-affinity nitrate transporter 3.1-like, partial [Impatiens glandulifera]|uniref:high-affinity nitrate transporter 3.1-like n=1 Tax=Impatiens glandulifera TaxID=253017 RepID=UPI001FB12EF3
IDVVLKAGEDKITITWSLNQTVALGSDSSYKTVNIKLCYGRISQVDRPWRKTVDDLDKDKTCQHKVVSKPYLSNNNSLIWMIPKDVPTASYFVRVYANNADDEPVGYGQTENVFEIQGISGRHATLDIVSACFSALSIFSLFGFFFLEKKKARARAGVGLEQNK